MFCDLVGSTGLSQRLDPEDLREIIAGFQEACSVAVKQFDGHVAQYLGDGVLVYFGFPHAHEDDAERAVRAALHLQASIARSNELPGARPVSARIGIHTGRVVVSDFGEGARQQPLALGETVNIASRLEGIAEPGEVVISQATLALAPGRFVTRDLGTPRLKGVDHPIRVHAVDRALGMGSRVQSAARLTDLAGREFELGQLRDRWRQVCRGQGQVVAISGEAGIGKSRLVLALRDDLAEVPHTWLETRCAPYSSGSALQPIVDLLQASLDFQAPETPVQRLAKLETGLAQLPGIDLDEVVPYLIPVLGLPASERHPLPDLGPELQREKTFEALISPLLAAVAQQPLLIVFEDLHWADSSTIELIGRLIDQAPTLKLMVMMTSRPHFQPPWPLTRSYICPLALTRLDEDQTRHLVVSAAGEGRLPPRIVEEIVARADGVPLFAEELARSVLDSGMVVEQDGRVEFRGSISDSTIPTTLQGSLMARLDRLSAAKSVAQIAATLGREFPYALIEAVADMDVAVLRSGLLQLVEAEIVFQRGLPPESHYTFKHALIQDTAYESQLKSRRKELHATVAHVLEERFAARVDSEPELIARHCAEGGLAAEAINHYQRAAQQAIQRLSNPEAVGYFGRALDLLAEGPESAERDQQEIALRQAMAGPQTAVHGYEATEVTANIQRVEALCEALGEGPQQLGALVGLSLYSTTRGDLPKASRFAARILRIAEPLGIAELEVAGHMIVGAAAITSAPVPEACAHLSRAIELAHTATLPPPTSTFDVDVLTTAFSTYAIALTLNGDLAAARVQLDKSFERSASIGHLNTRGTSLLTSAVCCYFLDDHERTVELARMTLEATGNRGFHTFESSALVYGGWGKLLGGDESGLDDVASGVAAAEASGSMGGLAQLYFTACDAHLAAGRLDQATRYLEAGRLAIERTGEHTAFDPEVPMFDAAIRLAADDGGDDEIEQLLDRSMELWSVFQSPWMELRSVNLIAQLALRRDRTDQARAQLGELCERFANAPHAGRVAEARGLLAQLG